MPKALSAISITLRTHDLHWLPSLKPCQDLCAHGRVEFSIDGNLLVKPEDGILTVSSSAILLLRTLHKGKEPLPGRGLLFPQSSFNFYKLECSPYIAIDCDAHGVDFEIRAGVHEVDIFEKKKDGDLFSVETDEWKKAVLSFSKEVLDFYELGGEKNYGEVCDEHAQNHPLLMQEWKSRHDELART